MKRFYQNREVNKFFPILDGVTSLIYFWISFEPYHQPKYIFIVSTDKFKLYKQEQQPIIKLWEAKTSLG